jgi:DNA-directed RNA polymerase beta subunit
MGSNMQRQSVPLILHRNLLLLENQIAIDSGTENAQSSGIVHSVTANKIVIKKTMVKN